MFIKQRDTFSGVGGDFLYSTVQYVCMYVCIIEARTWLTFVRQRISVAIAFASSHEIAQALGMSVATDPRGQ